MLTLVGFTRCCVHTYTHVCSYLPHGFEGANLGTSNTTHIAGADTRLFLVSVAENTSFERPGQFQRPDHGPEQRQQPERFPRVVERTGSAPLLLRLPQHIASLRYEILRRPSLQNFFRGIVIDYSYIDDRSNATLQREFEWLQTQQLQIVVDFTRATTLFPGDEPNLDPTLSQL